MPCHNISLKVYTITNLKILYWDFIKRSTQMSTYLCAHLLEDMISTYLKVCCGFVYNPSESEFTAAVSPYMIV